MILNLLAGVAQSVDLGARFGYVTIKQDKGTAVVYVDSETVTVGKAGALVINPSSQPKDYRYDGVQTLYAICDEDATVVIEAKQSWNGVARRTLTPDTVEVFEFGGECRSFEISNMDEVAEVYFALDRNPDSAEEWTSRVKPNSAYYPSEDIECFSIRVISDTAVEVEVRGYPKVDPLKRVHNTRR